MSNIDEDQQEEEGKPPVVPVGELSFMIDPKEHYDAKLLRRLDRETKIALDALMEIIENKENPVKERRQAAETIVTMRNNVSDKISKEILNRMVLESKKYMMSLPKMRTLNSEDEDEDSRSTPVVDFNLIQKVEDFSQIKM